MQSILIKIHRWFGFPIGLLFLVTFGTGTLTALNDLRYSAKYSDFQYIETTLAQQAQTLSAITEGRSDIQQIIMPTVSTPYFQIISNDSRETFAINSINSELSETNHSSGFFHIALNLHRHFLLNNHGVFGISGPKYVAWAGLAALFLSCLGVWLWWPKRRSFKLKNILPNGIKRGQLFNSHMTAGVISLLLIGLLAITGTSITYSSLAKRILGVKSTSNHAHFIEVPIENNWLARLNATYQIAPDSKLTRIQWSRSRQNQNHSHDEAPVNAQVNREENLVFRFNTANDWWGLDNSRVDLDLVSSAIIDVQLFENLSLREKIYKVLLPLHTGRGLPKAYVITLFLFSLLSTIMVISGVVSFVTKKRVWNKNVWNKIAQKKSA